MNEEIGIESYAPNTMRERIQKIRTLHAIRRAYRRAGTVPSNSWAIGNYNGNQMPPRR